MERDPFLFLRKTKGIQKREHYCTPHFLYTTLCVYERERETRKRETETERVCEQTRARGRVDVNATVV